MQDVRDGARTLGKNAGLTFVAVVSLALAIGANTAVFALVDAVLVRPLGFPEPDRLMLIWEASGSAPTGSAPALRGNVAPGNYRDWQAQSRTFDDVAAFGSIAVNQSETENPSASTLKPSGQTSSTSWASGRCLAGRSSLAMLERLLPPRS